jgi:hypothetical protein
MQTQTQSKEQESLAEFTARLLLSLKEQPVQEKQEQKNDLFSQRTGKSINRIEIPKLV